MQERRPTPLRWTLLIACSCVFIASGCGERRAYSTQENSTHPLTLADEREIVSTALKHLSERKDSPLGRSDGVILIKAKTDTWTKESFSYYSSDPNSDCPITLIQYDRFAERNPAQRDAHELVDETDDWKFASKDEEEDLLLIGKKHPSGREIRTLLSVSTPAGDTNSALVIFHFTWSIHGGLARYIVEHKNNHWDVKCSRIDIYV